MDDVLDCVVVGGGPAGLTAGIYLGRYLRRFLIVDAGDPRARWIPVSHNHPGFPAGIAGEALLARMREQACEYGSVIVEAEVRSIERDGELFVLGWEGREVRARTVLLATGVKDVEPALPSSVFSAVKHGLIRICPICDGYEQTGKAVGVLGAGDKVVRETAFLKTYTDRLTVILLGEHDTLSEQNRADLAAMGAGVLETTADKVRVDGERVLCFEDATGERLEFDTVYSALGTAPRGRLAWDLGAVTADDGRLEVNDHQMTSVDGLYAAGDLVRGLNQINIAMGEAAIATTDIHNRLRRLQAQPSSA